MNFASKMNIYASNHKILVWNVTQNVLSLYHHLFASTEEMQKIMILQNKMHANQMEQREVVLLTSLLGSSLGSFLGSLFVR